MKGLFVLTLAAAATCGGCREELPLAVWSGPHFSVTHPAGWTVRPAGDRDPQPAQPTGRCRNVGVPTGSRCTLVDVRPLRCPDCGPGEGLFRITHQVTEEGTEWTFRAAVVRAPEGRLEELRRLLAAHSPVGCSGLIVNPPCNPQGTAVALDFAWPDWAVVQRGW